MSLHKDYDENSSFSDMNFDEDAEDLNHKKQVRRTLEDRLERKRLREELEDELDEDFNWDELDK